MTNGISTEYLNESDETVEIEQIKEAFSNLLNKYNNIALLVNSEGTLLPYDFGSAKELILNVKDPYFMKKAKYALERLPRNDVLLDLLKHFMSINKDKTLLVSASNLDELEASEYQIFKKIAILEEELAQNQETLEREVGPVSSFKTSFAPNTLLIFFNDMVDQEGRPPITLTRYLHSVQPYASTLDALSIPIPRFTEKVSHNYKHLLYSSVLRSLQQKPNSLKDIVVHSHDAGSRGSFINYIKEAFIALVKQYNKGRLMLMIDHEGVLFPFNYKDIRIKLANDYWSDKRLKYEVERLPINTPLLLLLKDLWNIDREKVLFISASELDEFEKEEIINKEPIYEEILYKGYALLQKIGGKVYPLNTIFDPNSLLLFFNDTIDTEGRPPRSLISYILRTQKYADSLDMLSLPIPRFIGENNSEILYLSIYAAMLASPKPLKNINK